MFQFGMGWLMQTHTLTSQTAECSWDRLEPESASSRLCEHKHWGWGLHLQKKDGFLNPASCGTELHSQSWRRSHEPSCPFSEKANVFAFSSPQLCFSPLIASKPSGWRQSQSHDCCDLVFSFLRRHKCSHHYSHISFSSALQRLTRSTFTTNFLYQWKEKKKLQSAAPGWSAGSCVYSDMWEVPKKTERLGEVLL